MGNLLISWLLVLGLVIQPGPGFAQTGSAGQSAQNADKDTILPDSPFIRNYSSKDFQSHNQVWSIAEDQRGVMIFGNGEGWLEFDGARWRHTTTKNTVFSMAVDHNNVVYIGLINDFGRLLSDDRGKLVFESLTAGLSEHERKFDVVKQILATSQGLYFRTDSDLGFRWIDERLEKTEIDVGRFLSQVGDHVFGYNDSGIHILQGNKLVALPQTKSLGGKNQILRVLPYKERKLLIVAREKGLFLYSLGPKQRNDAINLDHLQEFSGQRIQVFATPVADYLRQYDFDQAIRLTNGDYVFGTRKGGLIIMSPSGKILHIIDESNGLIDNYVYDIYQEKNGNLWVATNNGISYVEISSPLSRFDDGKQIGFTLTAARYRDRLFVGGFKGAFYHQGYDRQLNPKLVPINELPRTCFDMLVYQDKLFLGGHYALVVIEGTQVVDQLKIEDEVVFSVGTSPRFPQHVFVGLTEGFSVLTLKETVVPGNTQIRLLDKQQGDFAKIKGMIRKIISDPEGNLWLADLSGQILYLRFRSDQVSDFDVYAYDHRQGLPETEFNMVHLIDGRLIVGTRSGIYTIKNKDLAQTDPESISFVLEDTFGRKPNQEKYRVHRIHKDQTGRIWISSYHNVSTLTPRSDGSYEWNRELYKKIEGNVESMFFDENDIVWFTSSKGLYRYDQKKEPKDTFDFSALISRANSPERRIW